MKQNIEDLKIDLGLEQGELSFLNKIPYIAPHRISDCRKRIRSLKQKIKRMNN